MVGHGLEGGRRDGIANPSCAQVRLAAAVTVTSLAISRRSRLSRGRSISRCGPRHTVAIGSPVIDLEPHKFSPRLRSRLARHAGAFFGAAGDGTAPASARALAGGAPERQFGGEELGGETADSIGFCRNDARADKNPSYHMLNGRRDVG
jgi:hypothetical protein